MMSKREFWQALIAILAGNAVYYILYPHLPRALQHRLYQVDAGLVLGFLICSAFYLLLRFAFPPRRRD
jgi:cytosine/uracil/thiamine/allantoin permease